MYVILLCKLLIKSGGGTRPNETRQPDLIKVPIPADFRKMRLKRQFGPLLRKRFLYAQLFGEGGACARFTEVDVIYNRKG